MSDSNGNGLVAKVIAEQVAKGLEATQSIVRELQNDIHNIDKKVIQMQGGLNVVQELQTNTHNIDKNLTELKENVSVLTKDVRILSKLLRDDEHAVIPRLVALESKTTQLLEKQNTIEQGLADHTQKELVLQQEKEKAEISKGIYRLKANKELLVGVVLAVVGIGSGIILNLIK